MHILGQTSVSYWIRWQCKVIARLQSMTSIFIYRQYALMAKVQKKDLLRKSLSS